MLVAAVVVLALASGWLALTSVGQDGHVGQVVVSFDPSLAQVVEIQRGEQTLRLERRGSGWVAASEGGVAAEAAKVESLLARLRGWRRERLVGRNPAQHAEFGVDAPHARRIRILGAKDHTGLAPLLSEVWVGRMTGVAKDLLREANDQIDTKTIGVFVRARQGRSRQSEPGPETWVVNDFVGSLLDPTPSRWFVAPISGRPQEVTRLEVRGPQGAHAIQFSPAVRLEKDPRPLDPILTRQALGALFLLRASAHAAGPIPADALQVVIERGDSHETVRLWNRGGTWFLARPGLIPSSAEGAVAVEGGDLTRLTRLATPNLLLRKRLIRAPLARAVRVHWRSEHTERSFLNHRSQGWEAVLTGQRTPLQTRRLATSALQPVIHALSGLEAVSWSSGPPPESAFELVAHGAWGRTHLVVGAPSDGRCPVSSSEFPGHLAWVSAEKITEIEALFGNLLPVR